MKRHITRYTFDASEQKVTFTEYAAISLDSILLVVNVTDNIIIYNFADSSLGGTVATNVLTLTYDTSSMDDADKLLIYYDQNDAINPVVYEDTSFVAGDSPVTLDFNNDLGRNATFWCLTNDGPGDITVDVSFDGTTWETGRTLKCMDEPLFIPGPVDSVKLTWVSNSAYRCWAK